VDSARALAEMLELWGHQVRIAHDGPAAIELALAFGPQVVLLDIGLPGMNGYEVARRLRGESALESTLLVAVTGYGQEDDQRKAQHSGFDRHLTKPVDLEALRKILAPIAIH
jgi:CheY-like chemotaxis protein